MSSPRDREWLTAASAPGRRASRLAAACQALETAFTVVQWAGLAWMAQDLLHRRPVAAWPALGVLLGGGLLAAASAWGAGRFAAAAHRKISTAIRERLVGGLLPAERGHGGGPDAATAALAAVELADDVAGYHAEAQPLRLSGPASMAIVFATTAAAHWPAALILLAGSLIIPVNMRLAGLFATEGADERVRASTRLSAMVLDSFRGMRTLRAIGAVARRRGDLAHAAGELDAATMAVVRRALVSGAVMDLVITFAIAVDATYIGLSLLGYVRLESAPRLTLFQGLLALLLCPMFFAPLRATAAAYHSRERAAAAVPTIAELAATEVGPGARHLPPRPLAGAVAVRIDDLDVRFPGTPRPILHHVDLTVHAGQWTAVVGPSGVGKTTLLSVIAGARRPTGGTVRWETTAGSVPPRLGGCAWIGQQTVILPGSIADNIRVGRPGASTADIEHAAAAAGLSTVIGRLSGGLDTRLGEGGWGLSTGEARRVAIARAFLRGADFWVLDEPTAHLDPDTEAEVIGALKAATHGRTVIVATHSAALARAAHTTLAIADGTVRAVREPVRA